MAALGGGVRGCGGSRSGVDERKGGSTSPELQRTMIGRRDRRGEPREQRAELGAFSTDHEHHPQRREARCRVHLPMPWLPTGTTCRGIQRAAAGCGQVCRAHMLRASLPCPDSRPVRLRRGSEGGAVQVFLPIIDAVVAKRMTTRCACLDRSRPQSSFSVGAMAPKG